MKKSLVHYRVIFSGAVITLLAILAACTSSPASTTSTTSTSTSPGPQPVEVVSVVGPLQPINPGGPVVEITLKNVGAGPVTSLAAILTLNSPFNFNFNVSPSSPLQSNGSISSRMTLIGAEFSDNISYPLEIKGQLQSGASFDYTVQVYITQPTSTTTTPGGTLVVNSDSIVTAKIDAIRQQTSGYPWELDVLIENSVNVEDLPNPTEGDVGKVVTVETDQDMSSYQVGDVVTARVKYAGDAPKPGIILYMYDIAPEIKP
jgi:hypothetical protein